MVSLLGSGRSLGGGNGNPLQYSCLENSMDQEAWWATGGCLWGSRGVGVAKIQMGKNLPAVLETRVRYLAWEDPLEEVIATHSSILAWRIPWTEELGRLQSMGSQRVRHD